MNRLESLQNDPVLMAELTQRIHDGRSFSQAQNIGARDGQFKRFMEGTYIESGGITQGSLEAVILDFLRPCLIIKNNHFQVPESDTWKSRLEPYRRVIEQRIPSIGRVEFKFHPKMKWGGTGWLIAPNMIVTNRHVAAEFSRNSNNGPVFLRNSLGVTLEASIDFREEYDNSNGHAIEIAVERVIYLADEGQPDIAILKLVSNTFALEPIPLLSTPLKANNELVVIGYPAYDPIRNPLKPEDVKRIFNDIFNYKRLSPGLVLNEEVHPKVFSHDATTLGGNSGSAVLDLKTGQIAGLHFSGVFHEANFAVTSSAILEALTSVQVQVPATATPVVNIPDPVDEEDTIELTFNEGTPADYSDREGYVEAFLGDDAIVPLPVVKDSDNILSFGDGETVLRYHHFSVTMNQSRRMCFYSAVNINGEEYRKTKRPGWKLDPRIPKEMQIMKECYGNPPKFSRGHMTRREDPAWGADLALATLGNADSMHVTNTVPQMQPFNAGIWLGLEEHALQNARGDAMKISVFTGPFFTDQDPTRFGVAIPEEFWKVIAFIHDETGELCATGYFMSQKSFLQPEEFVFGGYKTYQTTIKSIEQRAGISFGELTALDPYRGEELALSSLESFSQIRFKRS